MLLLLFQTMADKFNLTEVYVPLTQIYGSDLVMGRRYLLESISKIQTQYGDAIIVTLHFNGSKAKLFLPKAYAAALDQEDIDRINGTPHHIIMSQKVMNSFKYQLEEAEE